MFCPNCGTQNDTATTPCKKCGFKLSGVSAPKFKGTMVLNSDQTVRELVEEHRRRQAAEGATTEPRRASEPPPSSGSAPLGAFPGARGPVLQPPRVAPGSRRRMGGTMLGVAPQAGGLLPPEVAPRAMPATTPGAEPAPPPSEPGPGDSPAGGRAAKALASTTEMAEVPSPAPAPTAPSAPPPTAASAPLPSAAPPIDAAASDAPAAEAAGADAELTPAPRAIADTAPLPQPPSAPPASAGAQPAPARLRPVDIVLIIVTFGVYGIVLWARQRRPAP